MTTNPDPQLEHASTTELCTTTAPAQLTPTRGDRAPGMRWSWRTDRRFLWVGYQSPELTGVLGPAALVVFFHWHWAWLSVSVLVAAAWTAVVLRRRHNSAGPRPGALTTDQAAGTQTASTD